MIHPTDEYEDTVLRFLETELASIITDPYQRFRRTQAVAAALARFRAADEPAFKALYQQLKNYQALLNLRGLKESDPAIRALRPSDWLFTILGFPFYLYGQLNHLPLYGLIHWINRRFNSDPTYDGTFKFLSLWLGMPLFYGLQTWLVGLLTTNSWLPWIYLASLYPAGLLANYYQYRTNDVRCWFRRSRLAPQDKIGLLNVHRQLVIALEIKLGISLSP
ncbi:MAG: hypothetical protein KDC44_07445 [Phaeodactylibacter sp.]|nr:hypothetical protein [Phaeodactylibacter sp.]